MQFVKYWAVRSALVAFLAVPLINAACSKSPTAPTPPPPPPPPPPVAAAPSLSCGDGLSRSTLNAGGLELHFDSPRATDGEGAVNVSCSPGTGSVFPLGTTRVTCTATDSLNRTATCSFDVTISRLPTLSKTRFMAFGDSITQGEVTSPIGGSLITGAGTATKQIIVPAAAYPSVLDRTLKGRYATQASQIFVSNQGRAGEKAIDARNRYYAALSFDRPDAVMLMTGYNDIPSGADGAASTAASEMRLMAQEARLRGMRVFIATLAPPNFRGSKAISQFLVDDFNNRVKVIATAEGATLVDVYAGLLPDVQRYIGLDGLHPTEAGYSKIADLFFQAIQNAFEVR
jgi:lysophospholipase L1-like esterase